MNAKHLAKRVVYAAKSAAEENRFADLRIGKVDIFRMVKQMRRENQNIVGDKCVKDDAGNLSISDDAMKSAWKEHYERLLNVEFSWNPCDLSPAGPVEGPPIYITVDMILEGITKMLNGKAAGPSGIVAEMLKAAGVVGEIPKDWRKASSSICTKVKTTH